jgi:hypothetical protein
MCVEYHIHQNQCQGESAAGKGFNKNECKMLPTLRKISAISLPLSTGNILLLLYCLRQMLSIRKSPRTVLGVFDPAALRRAAPLSGN